MNMNIYNFENSNYESTGHVTVHYFLGDKFITINIDNITFWGNQFKPQQIDYIQEAVSNSMERDNSYIL